MARRIGGKARVADGGAVTQPRAPAAPLVLGTLACATGMLRFFDPAEARWLPFCLFHALTQLHCPGCGATRALHRLAHGDLLGALHMNALIVVLLPLLAYAAARRIDLAKRPRAIAAAAALAAAFALARNIPAYPFDLLAPLPIDAGGAPVAPPDPQPSTRTASASPRSQ